jgi:streptogramin lyase
VINHKSVKFNLKHNVMASVLFAIILLSVVPTMFSGFPTTKIVQSAMAQGEDPFQVSANETLTPAQQQAREQLLKEKGFTVNVIARNLSAPLNILYGPDGTLWITERVGKDIIRIDPNNGTKLGSMPIPNVNQSAG